MAVLNPWLFRSTTNKSEKERKELRLELETILLEKNLPYELKKYIEFSLKRAGASGLKKCKAKVNRYLKNPEVIEECFIVIGGNTFPYRERLKELNFKASKLGSNWINYRQIQEDKFEHWKKAVEDLDSGLIVFKSFDPDSVQDLLEEALKLEKEYQDEVKALESAREVDVTVEVRKWFARKIKEEYNMGFIFFNWKITKVYRATEKAIEADFEMFGGVGISCGRCGRALDNPISKACGIGPICASKMGMPRPTLENSKEILKLLEEKAKEMVKIEKKWIPKSQFKVVKGEL